MQESQLNKEKRNAFFASEKPVVITECNIHYLIT